MSAHIDIEALGGPDDPMIGMGIIQATGAVRMILGLAGARLGIDADDAADAFASWLREILGSGQSLDLALELGDPWLSMDVAYRAREGTRLASGASEASGLGALAAHAMEGSPYTLLFRLDPKWIAGVADVPGLDAALEGLTGDWLLSGTAGGKGIRAVLATRARDGPATAAALATFLLSLPFGEGFACSEEKIDAKGAFARRLRITADPEKLAEGDAARADALLGPDGLPVEIVARGDVVLVAWGEEGLGPRVIGSSKPPDALARRISELGGNLRFFAAVDIDAFMDGLRGIAEQVGTDIDLPAFAGACETHGTSGDGTWRFGFRADRDYLRSVGAGR
jgi:hypothetical protein